MMSLCAVYVEGQHVPQCGWHREASCHALFFNFSFYWQHGYMLHNIQTIDLEVVVSMTPSGKLKLTLITVQDKVELDVELPALHVCQKEFMPTK